MPKRGVSERGVEEVQTVSDGVLSSLLSALEIVSDPRKKRGKRYSLVSVLAIAILGCLCGCDDAEALEDWAKKEVDWLRGFLALPHGTPSQDVFLRVLAAIEPRDFRMAFMGWAREVFRHLGIGTQIAIDGQTSRGSRDRRTDKGPVHMVHALACDFGLVIGQLATAEKSNEIHAIPELLRLLDLRGALVSIDAMGCQVAMGKTILERGGDYLFGLKGNQSNLQKQTAALFNEVADTRRRTMDEATPPEIERFVQVDGGHGRIETREALVCRDFGEWVPAAERWPELKALIAIHSTREDAISGKATTEIRLYISSRNLSASEALEATRNHWLVENQLHWCLDVTFGQDQCRVRTRNAAENFAVVRHFAIDMLRAYAGDRYSIPRRRRLCSYHQKYREALLTHVVRP
jgi:predicted transposase YbfD/YdcC